MRSRNGNRNFIQSIQLIILLFSSLALNASEYLISYRYMVKDAVLYNESLEISRAMQKCSGHVYDAITFDSRDDKNLKKILTTNNEEFINYIHKIGLSLKHSDITTNYQHTSSSTMLTLKTTCFKVDFNDNFVKISPLK